MNEKRVTETRPLQKTDLIVVTGAGGFIGGNLVKYFWDQGFTRLRAVDKKPFDLWYQRLPGVENLQGDCSQEEACQRACHGATEVYNLAADMGGMGFIERFRVDCLRSVLINTQMIEAAYQAGVQRYFFSSSACVYNTLLQQNPSVLALKESDAYPAMAERGYGWEKLISEMFCEEYWAERGMKTFIARFHNVYGPHGTWDGGREKAPAAICRKVAEAVDTGSNTIPIWGDGQQTRSFMFIDDCIKGIDKIVHCDDLMKGFLAIAGNPKSYGKTYAFSGGEAISIRDMAKLMLKHVGQRKLFITIPIPICKLVAFSRKGFRKSPS